MFAFKENKLIIFPTLLKNVECFHNLKAANEKKKTAQSFKSRICLQYLGLSNELDKQICAFNDYTYIEDLVYHNRRFYDLQIISTHQKYFLIFTNAA